jgi:hypothetical protein
MSWHRVKSLFHRLVALGIDLFLTIGVGIRFVGNMLQTLLNASAKFFGLGAQLVVGELLHLRFERGNGFDPGEQALDFALIAGAEDFAQQGIDQERNPLRTLVLSV